MTKGFEHPARQSQKMQLEALKSYPSWEYQRQFERKMLERQNP